MGSSSSDSFVDGFAQSDLVGRKRMLAAAFAETLEQGLAAGVEEYDVYLYILAFELFDDAGNERQVHRQIACVDTDGNVDYAVGLGSDALGQGRQQTGGEIVDAVVAVVLQIAQHRTLAGTRTSADYGQFHARRTLLNTGR